MERTREDERRALDELDRQRGAITPAEKGVRADPALSPHLQGDQVATAVRTVQEARFGSDPDVIKQSPTMRYFSDMEARARDVYATEQGNNVGVNERAAQFIDKLVERAAQSDATRNVMVMGARAVIEETATRDRALREREEAMRSSLGRGAIGELSAVRDQLKAAEMRAMWARVPEGERERPLQREKTSDLMAAATVAADRESQSPSAENRRKAEAVEQELRYRRVEVATGARSLADLRTPDIADRDRNEAGVKVLNRMESKDAAEDRSASVDRRIDNQRKAEREAGIER